MTAPSERHAKSQVPLPTPDGNGEFHSRPRLPSGEPVPEIIAAPIAADYAVVPAAESLTAEVERVIRERVAALPRGTTYSDHVYIGPYLLIAERVLLGTLGCNVSRDPPVIDPFAVRDRKRFQQPRRDADESDDVA